MAEATEITTPEDNATNKTKVVTVENKGPLSSVRRIASDPSVRRSAPAALGVILAVIGLLAFYFLNKPPVTTLYAGMPEAEKARVVEALTNSGIQVQLDPTTGEI